MTRMAPKQRCFRCGRVWQYCECAPLTVAEITQMREWYAGYIENMRAAAREHGYALTEHGSKVRDCDLVAVPWIDEASDPDTLIEALRASIDGLMGRTPDDTPLWTAKPHGRKACVIHPREDDTGRRYFDISVMPRGIV